MPYINYNWFHEWLEENSEKRKQSGLAKIRALVEKEKDMRIHLDIVALRNKIGAIQQVCDETTDGLDQLEQRLELEFKQKTPESIFINIYKRNSTGEVWTSSWKDRKTAEAMARAMINLGGDSRYLQTKEIVI